MAAVSVTAPAGFLASATAAGIKDGGQLDLALVAATAGPVTAAGVFTRNRAAAAPVVLSRARLASGQAQAVVLNSGCANAGTGSQGERAVRAITEAVARGLGTDSDLVLACSTGPIGSRLDPDQLSPQALALVSSLSRSGSAAAAEAILTTDTHAKTVEINGHGFTVGGMAKGAGMLRPDMATMLCILTTDAQVEAATLKSLLGEAVGYTFNALNVDGCESTNDTVLLLASGEAGPTGPDQLGEALFSACAQLAEQLAADAEGSSRVVYLDVERGGNPGRGPLNRSGDRRLGVGQGIVLWRRFQLGTDPGRGRHLSD